MTKLRKFLLTRYTITLDYRNVRGLKDTLNHQPLLLTLL